MSEAAIVVEKSAVITLKLVGDEIAELGRDLDRLARDNDLPKLLYPLYYAMEAEV